MFVEIVLEKLKSVISVDHQDLYYIELSLSEHQLKTLNDQ